MDSKKSKSAGRLCGKAAPSHTRCRVVPPSLGRNPLRAARPHHHLLPMTPYARSMLPHVPRMIRDCSRLPRSPHPRSRLPSLACRGPRTTQRISAGRPSAHDTRMGRKGFPRPFARLLGAPSLPRLRTAAPPPPLPGLRLPRLQLPALKPSPARGACGREGGGECWVGRGGGRIPLNLAGIHENH